MRFDAPTADELCLVYDAWATSFRKSPWAGCVLNRDWDTTSRATIGEILDRGARILVAVQDIDESTRRVMGYAVYEPDINCLHWLYVKRTYRKLGVGKALLAQLNATPGWSYTHRTPSSAGFLGRDWVHRPELARVKR